MEANTARRVLHGLGANVYGRVVTVIVQLVGVPVLLSAWGTQLYGEWLILFAVPSYLTVTDLGFSQSAGNDMTTRLAAGDRAGALTVFQSLAVLVFSISAAGLALSAGVVWRLPLVTWMHFQTMNLSTARWVLWLLIAEVFAQLPNGVNHAGYRASGDYALHMGLEGTTRLLQYIGVWCAALVGGSPVAAATVFLGVRALATPSFALLLVHRHRWLSYGLANARRHELSRLGRPALANVGIPLARALNIQGMVLMVGGILGPSAVVVFSTLRTLTRLALQLVLAVAHSVEPELAVAYGDRDYELMRELFMQALRGGLWLALGAAVGLALFSSLILHIWTGGKVTMHPTLFAWLLSSAVASVLWYGAFIVLKATNHHLRSAFLYVLASGTVIGLGALLLYWTRNLAEAGLALLVMDAAMALYTLRVASKFLQIEAISGLWRILNPLPLMTLILHNNHFNDKNM